ncbi:MAG TPA: inositol monophosphatase family protein [Gemmatimonadaceae bacterium]|nr:inositol monophosphatase family protein [Gemmatimonadaceae bacterium]
MLTHALLLEAVRDAARVTAEVALHHFRRKLTIEWKADGSEVTVADRQAEEAARAWIAQRFPDDVVIGEEFGEPRDVRNADARRWYVDPIDGTRSFVRGVPLWGSMIAIEAGGVVLAGAICCPAVDELVAAARGEGCWNNGSRTTVSRVAEISQATILATDTRFRRHPPRAARWRALADRVAVARTWGDCYGYLLVATGRAELMVDDRLSPWDVAALIPILEEAGGVFTDWRGRSGQIVADGVASNAALAAAFREALDVPEPDRGAADS